MRSVPLLDSIRVLSAMVRVTAPTLLDAVRGDLQRSAIDDRTHWFARRVIDLLGINLTVTGAARVPAGRAYVYMSNHQSHLDIPILYAALPSPTIRMLAKKELFDIPLWGRGLRAAEFVEVDRGNGTRTRDSIAHATRLVRDGVSIYLAPEGTRSRDGQLGPLKKGGFHLALATGASIVPVAIQGTIAILPRDHFVMQRGQSVEVTIGAPIPVEARDIESLRAEVKEFLMNHVRGK